MEILLGIILIIGIGITSGSESSISKDYHQPEDQYVNQKVHDSVEKYSSQHEEEVENHENSLSHDFPQQHNQDQLHGGDNHYFMDNNPLKLNQYLDHDQHFGYDPNFGNDQHFGHDHYLGHDQHRGLDQYPHQTHDNHGNHIPDYSPYGPPPLPYNFNQDKDHYHELNTDDTFEKKEDKEEEYHQPDLYNYQNPYSPPILPQMDFGLMGPPGLKGHPPTGVGRPVPPQTQPFY